MKNHDLRHYSSYAMLCAYVKDAEREEKRKRLRERALDMIAGIGLAVMGYIITVTFFCM